MGLLNIYSSSVHLEGEYEKQRDAPAATLVQHNKSPSAAASAPGDADSAATRVQHNMPPSAAASAPGDADSAATLSAAQLATQTRNSRSKTSEVQIEDSSNNPELKKLNRCNYSSKRHCGLLGLLDKCTKTTCSFC